MPTAPRSIRQEQRELSTTLRAEKKTWAEAAAVFCERYRVNMRVGLRLVRCWSQRAAADQWNMRWPDDPKTFKNFSYWELWPGATGHAPSLEVLGRLAELYECSVADLVGDCADFRSADAAFRDGRQLATLPAALGPRATEDDARELVTQLELIDVHELARLTSAWSERLGGAISRRTLLLKLSAGLSLAAASPALADDTSSNSPTATSVGPGEGLTGIWHSRYVYSSSGRNDEFVGEHYLVARQHGNRLIGQSLPHTTGSQLRVELALEPPVATGTWRETTSPHGYYKGATYHGTLQFVIDPSGRHMSGMWLGFGRNFTINSGEWTLSWQEGSTAKSVQRRYHQKV